jgi:DNA adenine methylase
MMDRPVLRYHGGKFMLANWIISHFPECRIFVDLFGGGGNIIMNKEPCYAEVYNDRWDIVVNVFRVLRDPIKAKRLEELLRLTPYSRTEFLATSDANITTIEDDIERARLTIFRSFAGFGSAATNSEYATGFRANANRSGTTPAHDWANYPQHIEKFTQRLRNIVIENKDYRSIIKQQDSKETLFYADPPYVHETRNMKRGNAAYAHEMTNKDHIEMCKIYKDIKGMVIISGYDNKIYQKHLKGWRMETKETFSDGAGERTECLWISPNCKQLKQQLLFNKI